MSASGARVARVRAAGRRGPDRPSEDRVFVTPNAVVVLDGASQPVPDARDGGWLAETLGSQLRDRLAASAGADLPAVLAEAIEATARRHSLVPGSSPSTTVSIVGWDARKVDVLVLGDSPVIALTRDGRMLDVRDDRLSRVASHERRALRADGGGLGGEGIREWQALVAAQRRVRNQPDGYWIAEAVPEAAAHAVRARWDINDLALVMAMTDGVANGVDRYHVPQDWHIAAELARDDPASLVNTVHNAEEGDPDGTRWPRTKRHDDKAIVLVEFAPRGMD
jgi:Protein phosphatase 2C